MDHNLKTMQETLNKLKQDNQTLKTELSKKQVMNADMEMSMQSFDKEKYQLHA